MSEDPARYRSDGFYYCSTCRRYLPVDSFYVDRRWGMTVLTMCKKCRSRETSSPGGRYYETKKKNNIIRQKRYRREVRSRKLNEIYEMVEIMMNCGMSCWKISHISGVRQSTVRRIINGEDVQIRMKTCAKICKALLVTVGVIGDKTPEEEVRQALGKWGKYY